MRASLGRERMRVGSSPKDGSRRAHIKGRFKVADSANGGRGSSTATSMSEQEGANFVWFW
jgi:hypothetical protein